MKFADGKVLYPDGYVDNSPLCEFSDDKVNWISGYELVEIDNSHNYSYKASFDVWFKFVRLCEPPKPDIATLVKDDIEKRVQKGEKEYGERLTTFNGRNSLQDAYEEALDMAMYLKQAIIEKGNE